ncbi:MAG: PASTA domain-containing protein [Desulfobulbaceae bacterium]|nr:PASTA domain-containing protein [Desulfobulbaceae bacterium]HIJ79354.1 PASTA domain-containing protein [Deltaproteobacteria bacterium]
MKKRPVETENKRTAIWGIIAILLFVVLGLVAVKLQSCKDKNVVVETVVKDSAVVKQQRKIGERKNIFDRNFRELAVSFRRSSIYARPLELDNPEAVAGQVSKILAVDEKTVLADLKGERSFVWLGRDIPNDQAEQIVNLNQRGVYRLVQAHRFYPWGQVGAHVVGFLKDEQGLAGVESVYDPVLRGRGVYDSRLRNAGVSAEIMDGEVGADIILTLDFDVQAMLERKLKELSAKSSAQNVLAAMMVPDSGEIVALASLPAYDPNRFWDYEAEARRNRVVEDEVDLGAMKRLFCIAANLNNSGAEDVAGSPLLGNDGSWHWLQSEVYVSAGLFGADGSNCGPGLEEMFKQLGLLAPGEIDLPGAHFLVKESEFSPVGKYSEVEFEDTPEAAIKVQGEEDFLSKATPLALLAAFARLINNGKEVSPHVLKAIWSGEQVWRIPAQSNEGRYSVEPQVSQALLAKLRLGVSSGKAPVILESMQQQRVPGRPAAEGDFEEKLVADTILLGAYPVEKPVLALVVIMEGAEVDVRQKSAAREMADNFLVSAQKIMAKQAALPNSKELERRGEKFYKQWQKLQAKSEMQPSATHGPEGLKMPDVRGGSLRKALQVLQPYGLRVRISGSGRVVNQYPPSGSSLLGVKQCVLELKVM